MTKKNQSLQQTEQSPTAQLCEVLDVSQSSLAATFGVSPVTVWRWYHGQNVPKRKLVEKIEFLLRLAAQPTGTASRRVLQELLKDFSGRADARLVEAVVKAQ